jgi:hypothetical protein
LPECPSGLIERVTFFNEENGFGVLKVKAKGHRDLAALALLDARPVTHEHAQIIYRGGLASGRKQEAVRRCSRRPLGRLPAYRRR